MWLSDVVARCHETLMAAPEAEAARAYLLQRGVPAELWQTYQLGYSLPDLTVEQCAPSFLTFRRWFYGRLVFPFFGATGDVIGIQTRPVTEKAYQTYHLYPTEVYPLLFGLGQAIEAIWRTRQVVIVEGVFDALAVRRAGASNVVAVMTARVPEAGRVFLRRFASRVLVLLDMDEPGRAGAFRLVQTQDGPYSVLVPPYPAHDPAELVCKPGGEAQLRHILRGADQPFGAQRVGDTAPVRV